MSGSQGGNDCPDQDGLLLTVLYPQHFIDDLRDRADIVRIIEPYSQLKKKGANWMGRCPFHEEKTPSFSVNPTKGFYKCFGCGKGGSVYNFLMEIEGLNFPEAVKRVAEISGVSLPEPVDDKQYEQSKKRREEKKKLADRVIELNRIALEFWEAELQKKNAKAKAAREYLESRGISTEIQRKFRIGFSPDSWDSLLNVLREKGAKDKLIEQSGLVSVSEEKHRVFDRFRGRIMFPVLDVNGDPVAFGARAMGSDEPKYLNSPETPAYVKGRHLYGLFQAKEEIRKKKFVILVEGYLDLIALHQFDIKNVAASLGTALTPDQSKLLSRFAKRVVINYDGDTAGIKAARRAVEVLLPEDFEIKVLILPDGKDPDDFVREQGHDAYNKLRGRAMPYLQFVLDAAVKGRSLGIPDQKAAAIEEVLPVVAAIHKPFEKRETLAQVMSFFQITDPAYKRELANAVRSDHLPEPEVVHQQVKRVTQAKTTVAEQLLLELLVYDRELRDVILPQLEHSDYEALATASIFRALITLDERNEAVTMENLLNETGDDGAAEDLIPLLMMGEPKREPGEVIDQVLHDAENCVFTLRLMAISARLMEISRDLILAEQTGNGELLNRLLAEHLELGKIKLEFERKVREI